MLILSIDGCGAGCAAGLWRDGRLFAHRFAGMQRGQDAHLIPLVQAVMDDGGYGFDALDRIAVTRGPGSFTGLRVGLAAAIGLGMAAGKTVIGLDRFTLYRTAHPAGDVLVTLDSRRADLFCRFYPASGAPQQAVLWTADTIAAFAANHPGLIIVGDAAGAADIAPDILLAAMGDCAARADLHDAYFAAQPLYLRAPDVTMPTARII